jgi:FlaA1/EpsC-like NDP-sugar epimerase
VTDLLGRHQIDTDIGSIAHYLTGKRVLVTGAGGSIGSELCRQIARFSPAELIMLDRDESALHAVQLSIYGRAMLDSDDVVLADIRDSLFIDALFDERKPHVVFHAAALKHLPMLEQYPGEAVKSNVWGSLSVLESAKTHGVERFVNISTDKAANPCSVLGYSKRLAEGLTAAIAEEADGIYLSVRFGNVLGSRGSVLTAFAAQIAGGGPVTVTDPDVTRYFMTVREAVQLVVQAAAIGRDGEVLVLDMGEPVAIDGVARQLIELSGKEIDIVYTGLRDGEKMHEELWGDGESDLRPTHPLVSQTPVPAYNPLDARALDPWADRDHVTQELVEAVNAMSTGLSRPAVLVPARAFR